MSDSACHIQEALFPPKKLLKLECMLYVGNMVKAVSAACQEEATVKSAIIYREQKSEQVGSLAAATLLIATRNDLFFIFILPFKAKK